METLLQGVNQPVQNGVSIPDNFNISGSYDSTPYNAGFWDWLQSVSGINFYKNLFGFNAPNQYDSFWDIMSRDPYTGYSFTDSYSKSIVGNFINDLVGKDSPTSYDENALNDLPDELFDIFKQGLDLFNQNKVDQMYFNQSEADKNRAWQEYMSDTAYQRAMLDLKKAGINPLLAFGSLNPASTPSGDSASASLANSNSLFSSMASSVLGDKKLTMQLLTALLGIFRIFTGSYTFKK